MTGDIAPVNSETEKRYFNRELSWLFFNSRVLEEAQNPAVPLLERVRFLSISASNLDEFYMVRVAGLRTQVLAGMSEPSFDGYTPERQLKKIAKRVRKIKKAQAQCWTQLHKALTKEKVNVLKVAELSDDEREELALYYARSVLPLLTPMAVDPAHPFPHIPNLGFGMVLALTRTGQKDTTYALIPIPAHVPRFIALGKKERNFVLIEDVLEHFAPALFPDFTVTGQGVFRVTRDSDIAVDEEAEDLVRHFEFLLKKRRRGRVIRLEVNADIDADLKDFLIESFECWDEDIHESDALLGMTDLSQLIGKQRTDLLFPPFQARFPERIREYDGDCFAAIAAKDILVHHPYEDFNVVVQFLEQAALDPSVVAIKQTLYRTSDDSPIVKALIEAAERGKTVTALVELKARFDEETNLRWARDLERAGAHVVYGFIDYKTHAKVSIVVRREHEGLKTYTHLGTGNYHAQNAKIYTDLALFTADPAMGRDVGKLFNYVTSYSQPRDLEKLIIAPMMLRKSLIELIQAEIDIASSGGQGAIWVKLNALVDSKIIDKLYEASQAGVQIDLIVRGICCLRPGVEGLSENIRVKSIIGRFLEHSRIACFGNGKALPNRNAKLYFSSADWMPRNLNRRVETLIPVEATTVRNQIMDQIMVANLNDNTNSWDLTPNGTYVRRQSDDKAFSAHDYFMQNPSLSGRGKSLRVSAPKALDVARRKESKSTVEESSKVIDKSSVRENDPKAANAN
ncbi:RNA degradosome polyphosphate kinase [Hellea balneolensis]|uniref:RNA degradosome polyphosphate kinase n=1 Tax=Hellea balneolensis TaxID=287478 RepID=UPI000424B795|nr:RNA degradosome polyphosphate kinase [Hellea balneolensis]